MERSLEDIIEKTQARIATQTGAVGPTEDNELEEDPELEGSEDTDDSDDDDGASGDSEWEYDDDDGEQEASDDDDDVTAIIAAQVEQRVAAALSPLTDQISALTKSLQQAQQKNQPDPRQQAQQEIQQIMGYLAKLPEDQREAATQRMIQVAVGRVVQENQQLKMTTAQEAQLREQTVQHEAVIQFIAEGGRWVPDPTNPEKGAYKEGVAPKLTPEEVDEMREYVKDDGWSMEKWANKTLKARGARKTRTKTIGKALTKREAATPRVKGRGNAEPKQSGTELTIDQIAEKAANQVAQGMRARR